MVSKKNFLKNFGINAESILGSVALIVLIYAIYKYSNTKNTTLSGMNVLDTAKSVVKTSGNIAGSAIETTGNLIGGTAQATGNIIGAGGDIIDNVASVTANTITDVSSLNNSPSDQVSSLLPNNSNNSSMSMVDATFSQGVRELYKQQSPMRNSNLQLRDDPIIPSNTNSGCLWNQSTIESSSRRPQILKND
tara:strand:- start:28769 stop:29344 length:576 start_codon:yes stop_codon:yes gene_type:complete